ncbi:ABC transporter permease [Pectobacterium brasiliense]|uniref:ABC transporter permease n=1 Tax=Pectobacterium brasiliense TaxID=180957 RepID=A0A3S0ZK44_9GAMM|nr:MULTISPECIES: ABC transporter permease [Pectobacterium]GKW30610.1 ABC transporter permease [Pectobacterium carotovorum subsp. carotovorum]MBN3049786.1 ABC transporter permease [Pectobacterium brasiliense]MBN3077830.1 ABC transporter permease [Pectobacterium brasiliense]MBN3085769.1 ABC transporter permease [Pectobacterium brasiliense]MBN3091889.1 ABC transporter permease [Pectobacterium brasiliense]
MLNTLFGSALRALLTVFLAVTFTFVMLRISGDPMTSLLGVETPPQVIEILRQQWGLDRPVTEQYFTYLGRIVTGDFGTSLRSGQDALAMIMEKIPATLRLMAASLVLALAVGIPLGIVAAHYHGRIVDRTVIGLAVLTHSIPTFLTGILLIQLFAVQLRILPSGGGATLAHMVMPALAIGLYNAGVIARFVRSSVLEVIGQRYILAARAKRVSEWGLIVRHVMPNAALPLLTLFGFLLGGMIGGSAVIEAVFAWPGVGLLLINSVAARDVAVVQAIVILITVAMVSANLFVDFLHVMIDPRLRHSQRSRGRVS